MLATAQLTLAEHAVVLISLSPPLLLLLHRHRRTSDLLAPQICITPLTSSRFSGSLRAPWVGAASSVRSASWWTECSRSARWLWSRPLPLPPRRRSREGPWLPKATKVAVIEIVDVYLRNSSQHVYTAGNEKAFRRELELQIVNICRCLPGASPPNQQRRCDAHAMPMFPETHTSEYMCFELQTLCFFTTEGIELAMKKCRTASRKC